MKTTCGLLVGVLLAGLFTSSSRAFELPATQDTYANISKSGTTIAASSGGGVSLPVSAKAISYVQFDLDALPEFGPTAFNLNNAWLQLYVDGLTAPGNLSVYLVTTPWQETFKGKPVTAPTLGAQVATISSSALAKKSFVSVDVTSALNTVLQSGTFYGFAIVGSGTTNVAFSSKEGPAAGSPPTLVLDWQNAFQVNSNTATGANALSNFVNAESGVGQNNTADGLAALYLESTGSDNVAVGLNALRDDNGGSENTAVGFEAMLSGNNSYEDTAVGSQSMANSNGAQYETAVGGNTLKADLTGFSDTAIGFESMLAHTTNGNDTAVGSAALRADLSGQGQTAVGASALVNGTSGDFNTAIGFNTLNLLKTGTRNIALGHTAGYNLVTGSNNIYIGDVNNSDQASESATESNIIRIGSTSQHTAAFIAGIRGETTGVNNAIPVMIDGNGQLGTVSSSRRYKEDIHPMADASEALLRLKPVTFRYKKPFADGGKPIQYGLIAEDVAEVFPDLVVNDDQGKPQTVKYQLLAPILLNEFLKEHQQVAAMQGQITAQNRQIEDWQKRFAAQEKSQAALAAQLAAMQQQMAVVAQRLNGQKVPVANVTKETAPLAQAQ
jgi:hypothetical protein